MRNARYLNVLLLLVWITPLQGCGPYPGDGEIDPSAGLQRSDYTVSPEVHVTLTLDGEKHILASSTVSLAGDAHDDVAVYDFIDRVKHVLPGRARLQHLTIQRAQTSLGNTGNVHFDAAFDWLSNGSLQTVATVP